MCKPNTIFSVTRSGSWSNSGSTHIGYFKTDSILQIGEWLLLNADSPDSNFDIKEIDINDITKLEVKFAASMADNDYNNYNINKHDSNKKALEHERLKLKALRKLSEDEKHALGLK